MTFNSVVSEDNEEFSELALQFFCAETNRPTQDFKNTIDFGYA